MINIINNRTSERCDREWLTSNCFSPAVVRPGRERARLTGHKARFHPSVQASTSSSTVRLVHRLPPHSCPPSSSSSSSSPPPPPIICLHTHTHTHTHAPYTYKFIDPCVCLLAFFFFWWQSHHICLSLFGPHHRVWLTPTSQLPSSQFFLFFLFLFVLYLISGGGSCHLRLSCFLLHVQHFPKHSRRDRVFSQLSAGVQPVLIILCVCVCVCVCCLLTVQTVMCGLLCSPEPITAQYAAFAGVMSKKLEACSWSQELETFHKSHN